MSAAAPLVLRFTEWRCGHHGQRPADIEVQSPEQALLIARAISHAISQPGHARAVVMSHEAFEDLYITDDYVAAGNCGEASAIEDQLHWAMRPVVIYGSEAEIAELCSPQLAAAVESLYGEAIPLLEGSRPPLGAYDIACSTLALDELERIAAPVEWHEARRACFEAPPVFKPVGELLPELRDEAAYMARPNFTLADLLVHWTDASLAWQMVRPADLFGDAFTPTAAAGLYVVWSEVLDARGNYPSCHAIVDDFGTLVPLAADQLAAEEQRPWSWA